MCNESASRSLIGGSSGGFFAAEQDELENANRTTEGKQKPEAAINYS